MATIAEKVEHVQAAPNPGCHGCHWPGCMAEVKPAYWGCRRHWYMLPRLIRAKIWAAYRPGQEVSKKPSKEYVDAANEAQEWIAKNPDPRLAQPDAQARLDL